MFPRLPRPFLLATALALAPATLLAGERALLMFQRDGCSYCRRWDAEIAPAYPRTAEGQAAPLIRLDIHDPLPDGVTLTGRPPAFTPTFVLTDDGTEVARIEGYAGDEFFWVMLTDMLVKNGWDRNTPVRPLAPDAPPSEAGSGTAAPPAAAPPAAAAGLAAAPPAAAPAKP